MEIYTKYDEYEDSLWVSDSPMKLQDGQWAVTITADDGALPEEPSSSVYVTSEGLDQLIPELTRLREDIRARHAAEAEAEWQIAQLIEDQGIKYFNKGNGKWLCEGGCTHSTDWFSTSLDIKIIVY